MISVIKAMYDAFGIDHGTGITVHAQTDSNETFPSKSGRARDPLDVGRGDSVRDNIIPASTGASKNLYKMIPELQGKFEITAVRVGVVSASFWQVSMDVNKEVSVDEVRAAIKDFALNKTDGVVKFYEGDPEMNAGPLDSNAVVGWNNVSIIDNLLNKVLNDGKTVILQGFYDNQSAAPNQIVSKWAPWMVDAVRVQQLVQVSHEAVKDGGAKIASAREDMNAVYNKVVSLPADGMSQLTDNDLELLLWKMSDISVTFGVGSAQMMDFRKAIGKLSFGQIRRLEDIAAGVRNERDRQVFAQRKMSGTLAQILAMDTSDVIANADAPAVVREVDFNVYEQFKAGYSEILNNARGQSGALIIGAHVLENAGVISAIKTLKDANKELKVVVWAETYETLDVLDATMLTGIVDKFSSRGFQDTIIMARQMNIEAARIIVINSPEDVGQKGAELDSVVKSSGVRAINLKAPYYKQVDGNKINAMPLVIGKAVAMIFNDKQEVVDAYMQMAQQYGGQISDAEMKQLTDLTEQLTEVPLVKVTTRSQPCK
jgi:glyceraldehyde-3-phosphate dehydrogenase/erythrose-4-phosphate dehydrogenase